MKRVTAILATTHIDKHNERMSLSLLESLTSSMNNYYFPLGVEHDPRIAPIGRIASAKIKKLEDGEYGIEAMLEIFESGNMIEASSDSKTLPIHERKSDNLYIAHDRNFRDSEDQLFIQDIGSIFNSSPEEEVKKALDPLSVLTIGGIFIFGAIAKGFLGKLGADGYELLRDRIKKLFNKKKQEEKEKILKFELVVHKDNTAFEVYIILTNPDSEQIDMFLTNGLYEIDSILNRCSFLDNNIHRIVFEYSKDGFEAKFGIRKDCIPFGIDKIII